MKKILSLITASLAGILLLTACSSSSNSSQESTSSSSSSEEKVIKVAAHTSPMTDMLDLIAPELEKEGYKLEVTKVSDNVQANVALANKEVDANFFQHKLFMEEYNKGNGSDLVQVQPVYNAIVAFYSKNYKSTDELPDGATIAIPSDTTNKTRALRLLAQSGLITLKDPASYSVTPDDIAENNKNLTFTEVSLLNLNEAYEEADLVFNYPAYASKIGLTPADNGLILENPIDATFAVSLVARADNKDSEVVQALKKALTSDTIKNFIETNLKGHAVVAFD